MSVAIFTFQILSAILETSFFPLLILGSVHETASQTKVLLVNDENKDSSLWFVENNWNKIDMRCECAPPYDRYCIQLFVCLLCVLL